MMAELSGTGDQDGRWPEVSHTFIIEIDRRGSKDKERLRWKWPQSQNSCCIKSTSFKRDTAVAEQLLSFLDTHLANEPGRLDAIADSSARVLADQRPRGYSVEVHHPALGGWSPLSTTTASESIPKNCRVHVSVDEDLKAALPQQPNMTPSLNSSGDTAGAAPSLSAEQPGDETGRGEMLALPWRRFDQDLGSGSGDGFQICGRRMVVEDVSNSSEGTGLFTWDGSVLLARYLEHQAAAMLRDFDNQRSLHQTRPISNALERAKRDGGVINATGGEPNSFCEKARPAVRILELGCGTGLAGLAAAFSFGRREGKDSDIKNAAALSRPPRRSSACAGEGEISGSVECASSPTIEYGVEVTLTDLEYALENARANIHRNASSLEAVGSTVNATELDWCRPVPDEFAGGDAFDLILAADVVWLDELVEPLVRTLERLTSGWRSRDGRDGREQQNPQELPAAIPAPSTAATAHASGSVQKCQGAVVASPSLGLPRLPRPRVGQRVLLAYQWRSRRTGDALLEELEKAFRVREIQPEECHPEYLPSSNLCLFEIVRR